MKLNLGCADHYIDGWVNVDWAGSPHRKDATLDLAHDPLPWKVGAVVDTYAGHVLEHLELDAARRLLRALHDCTADGGHIMVVGPDVDLAEKMIKRGTFDFRYHTLESIMYGDDRWPGTKHRWLCTAPLVMDLLADAGWSSIENVGIENVAQYWPVIDRTQLWQCAVGAVKL